MQSRQGLKKISGWVAHDISYKHCKALCKKKKKINDDLRVKVHMLIQFLLSEVLQLSAEAAKKLQDKYCLKHEIRLVKARPS